MADRRAAESPGFARRGFRAGAADAAPLAASAGLGGLVDYAAARGAPAVEAYPIDPKRKMGSGEVFTGLLPAFLDCGFAEVARRSPIRSIARRDLKR
jgi:hypothetical protein